MFNLKTSLLAAMVACGATAAGAATLGLPTNAPTFGAAGIVDYLEFGPDGDLSMFGAPATVSSLTTVDVATAELDFGFGFDLGDPFIDASGGFAITDANGTYLSGDLWYVGAESLSQGSGLIELQFGNLSGYGAAEWTQTALMNVIFDGLGSDVFAALQDGDFYDVEIALFGVQGTYDDPGAVAPAPIPLPATMWLLAAGFGGLITLRRKQG